MDAQTKTWDQRLNAAYQRLKTDPDPEERQPLQAAQRLWIKYRDANCGYYASAQGTIREIRGAECMSPMTKDRALELEEEGKGGSSAILILLAKSQIRVVHVWQVLENPVCQRAGLRENDFAIGIKNGKDPGNFGELWITRQSVDLPTPEPYALIT